MFMGKKLLPCHFLEREEHGSVFGMPNFIYL